MQRKLRKTEWIHLKTTFDKVRKRSPDYYERIEELIDDQVRLRFGNAIYNAIRGRYGHSRPISPAREFAASAGKADKPSGAESTTGPLPVRSFRENQPIRGSVKYPSQRALRQ